MVSGGPTVDLERRRVVDDLVAELHAVMGDLDLAIPAAPEGTGVLAEIDQAIGPARLPSAARGLWELVEPGSSLDGERIGATVSARARQKGVRLNVQWLAKWMMPTLSRPSSMSWTASAASRTPKIFSVTSMRLSSR